MSKNKIRIIISLMALSSICLIAFQIYWIGYTARSNNEVFGANVREAMQEVVRKLEKQELIYITQKKTIDDKKVKDLLAMSTRKPIRNLEKPARIPAKNKELISNSINELKHIVVSDGLNPGPIQLLNGEFPVEEINIQFNLADPENPTDDDLKNLQYFNDMISEQLKNYGTMVSEVDSNRYQSIQNGNSRKLKKTKKSSFKHTITSKQLTKLNQKTELLKDVFDDYLLKERPIFQRLNRNGLDSLLKQEISLRGYNIPFEYGVGLNKDTTKLHFLSSPHINLQKQKLIKTNGFKASLFPNDLFVNDNQLFVYFPTKKEFIMQSIWLNILGSIAMLGIVLTCFYIAVNTILKQKKLAEIKNDFINNMTHEFKTPISTISLACEVLNDKQLGNNPTIVSRYLGIINDENKRLGTQVEKVLQTALMDKGDVKMKLSPLNIHTILTNVVENISPQIDLKNGKIDLSLAANNADIQADTVHITNIIFNLLDNAIKYSKTSPEIKVESQNTDTGILIRVIDNGIGMNADEQKNIFEKFYRVPTGNRHDVKGFGLGLSYVKKMVEDHHGTIKVNSKIGIGSTFELFLPQN
jgi:two-component system, OmpR family, phosphate regulon sensor histidine kinase PhoR